VYSASTGFLKDLPGDKSERKDKVVETRATKKQLRVGNKADLSTFFQRFIRGKVYKRPCYPLI
jgi:hypothetical protein